MLAVSSDIMCSDVNLETPPNWHTLNPNPVLQDLLGRGTLWSKRPWLGYFMGGLRDGGFGVYAKCGKLKQTLQQRWAGELA